MPDKHWTKNRNKSLNGEKDLMIGERIYEYYCVILNDTKMPAELFGIM
jgi:hypothetical protein